MADEVVTPEVTAPVTPEVPASPAPETPATPSAAAPDPTFYSGSVPKELEAQYKEMQAAFTRSQQALSRERIALRSPAPSAPAPQPVASGDEAPNPVAGQLATLETQVREMKLEAMNTQIDRFAETHKDVYEHAGEMADMMLQVPNLSMDKAYWAVKGPKAEQAGRMEAMKTLQAKIAAPSSGPVGNPTAPTPKKTFSSIADAAKDAYNSVASRASNA